MQRRKGKDTVTEEVVINIAPAAQATLVAMLGEQSVLAADEITFICPHGAVKFRLKGKRAD
ncbi:MAG: hypothetical protein QMD04_05595 [Anaerolineales bacterium]|nr:hypothetical protein [Anaerolineales bacterium]